MRVLFGERRVSFLMIFKKLQQAAAAAAAAAAAVIEVGALLTDAGAQ